MKGIGYLVSGASVYLLAVAAYIGKDAEPFMTFLVLGCILSVVGMFMRWVSAK